jgi:hypothetical protein
VYLIFVPVFVRARATLILVLLIAAGWFFEKFNYHMRNLEKLRDAGQAPTDPASPDRKLPTKRGDSANDEYAKLPGDPDEPKAAEAKGFAFSGESGAAPQITKWLQKKMKGIQDKEGIAPEQQALLIR